MAFQALVIANLVKEVIKQGHVAQNAHDECLKQSGVAMFEASFLCETVDDVESEELSLLPLNKGLEGQLAGVGGH